ncbi:hypothetical protein BH10PLA1_BH10PLA1_12390 [soil metagenome]
MSESESVHPDQKLLHEFFRDRDVPCPRCSYNLRNLSSSRCPECGDELVLRVNLAEPRLGAFITGLVGLAAGAGFSGLLMLYALYFMFFVYGYGRGMTRFVAITAVGAAVMGLGLLIWIRGRAHVRRLPVKRQWLLAISCWSLTLADLILFSKLAR